MMKTIPAEQIYRYCRAGSTASAGVRMAWMIAPLSSSRGTMTTPATMAKNTMEVPITSRMPRSLPPPQYCPSSTEAPVVRPKTTNVTVSMIWLEMDTADTSAVAANRPTTHMSVALYTVCRMLASRTGQANFNREASTLPVTREFFFSMGDPSFGARKTREYENMLTKRKHNVNEHKNVKRHFQFTAKYIKIWGAEKNDRGRK